MNENDRLMMSMTATHNNYTTYTQTLEHIFYFTQAQKLHTEQTLISTQQTSHWTRTSRRNEEKKRQKQQQQNQHSIYHRSCDVGTEKK